MRSVPYRGMAWRGAGGWALDGAYSGVRRRRPALFTSWRIVGPATKTRGPQVPRGGRRTPTPSAGAVGFGGRRTACAPSEQLGASWAGSAVLGGPCRAERRRTCWGGWRSTALPWRRRGRVERGANRQPSPPARAPSEDEDELEGCALEVSGGARSGCAWWCEITYILMPGEGFGCRSNGLGLSKMPSCGSSGIQCRTFVRPSGMW